MGLSLGIGLGITHGQAKAAVSSGSAFSLTIPVSGSFTLTAAGNATGVTAVQNAAGDGVSNKGDKATSTNVSINSGDILFGTNNPPNSLPGSAYSYLSNQTRGAFIVAANDYGGSTDPMNEIGTVTTNGGNIGNASEVISGTTAAAGLAFTCPTLITEYGDSGTLWVKTLEATTSIKVNDTVDITIDQSYAGLKVTAVSANKVTTDHAGIGSFSGVSGGTVVCAGSIVLEG